MQRRSVRNFEARPIPDEIVDRLVQAANNAPSGGNIQPLSIVLVQAAENRARLAELVGEQPWVRNAPLSMIFCLDFHRVKRWAALNDTEFLGERAFSHFLIAYADLMAAAQTVTVLAESLGIGSVYVGTIQSNVGAAREVFELPEHVLPLMVLTLGYPKTVPHRIPKLKPEVIVHREKYRASSDAEIAAAFDAKYGAFDRKDESYLEKAFIEAVEADKQGGDGWSRMTMKEMTRLEISNNAQFLFRFRYPAEEMVKLNARIIDSFRRAGFDFFGEE